jgi:mRNA interferase RelE/StbE
MDYKVIWSISAKKDLDKLPNTITKRIIEKVHLYIASPNPLTFAKRLTGNFEGYYRFRVGKYRVIFEQESAGYAVLLLVLSVDKRDNAYF